MDSILLFFLSVIVGLAVAGMAYFLLKAAQSRGKVLAWWHWLLSGFWVLSFLVAFAWLGSFLGEGAGGGKGLAQGAWLGWAIIMVVNIIIGLVIWQTLKRQKATA